MMINISLFIDDVVMYIILFISKYVFISGYMMCSSHKPKQLVLFIKSYNFSSIRHLCNV